MKTGIPEGLETNLSHPTGPTEQPVGLLLRLPATRNRRSRLEEGVVPDRSPAAEVPGERIVTDADSIASAAADKIPMGLVPDPLVTAAEAPSLQGAGN